MSTKSQPREVHIIAASIGLDIEVPMGDGVAVLTGGLGGYRTIERQDDVAVTDWSGQGPLTQDVPLMLDGGRKRNSVEGRLAQILRLGRSVNGGPPPVFVVGGPVHLPGNRWVLPEGGIELSTDPTECMRRNNGELHRQALTLHLLEYVEPATIDLRRRRQRRRPDPRNANGGLTAPGNVYVVHAGETLASIAARLYGDVSLWRAIGKLNKLHDPHRKLTPGTKLRIPKGWPD